MAVKATTKTNTKTEPVKEEVKTVEEKTAVKKETAKKPAAKKETVKKAEEVKAVPEKKTAAKKTTAKAETKATAKAKAEKKAEVTATVNFQFDGKSYTTEDLLKSCRDVWKYDLGGKEEDIKSIDLYVKPEESVTYYVINGDVTGSFFI